MAMSSKTVKIVDIHQLAAVVRNHIDNVLVIDSRSFLEFNTCHIVNSVNVCCSKIVKRRLQQDKITVKELLIHTCQCEVEDSSDIIVYDQGSLNVDCVPTDSFLSVLLQKLLPVFNSVNLVRGGFLEFQAAYPNLCEDKTRKCVPLTSLSQPCLPVYNQGPTRILSFLYLGSQQDALNKEALNDHNITYELNVSTTCPKPDFIQDAHFMRIPVNDNYNEKLLPYFPKAFYFLDKVREGSGCVLVHCLAGISRSATVAIAYVMRYLRMTSDAAYRYVKSKRATISPNFNFLGQLLEYEKLLQKDGVLDSKMESVSAPILQDSRKYSYYLDTNKPYLQNLQAFTKFEPKADFQTTWKNISKYGQESSTNEFQRFRSRSCATSLCVNHNDSTKHTVSKDENLNKSSSKRSSEITYRSKFYSFPVADQTKKASAGNMPWNIEGIPISSLKELNFTPCQTSASTTTTTDVDNIGNSPDSEEVFFCGNISLTGTSSTTNYKQCTYSASSKMLEDCKLETYKNLASLPHETLPSWCVSVSSTNGNSFLCTSKEYNRSDSLSTSGLGSESSDCTDSWSEYHTDREDEYNNIPHFDFNSNDTDKAKYLLSSKLYGDSYSLPYKDHFDMYRTCKMQSPVSPSEKHFLEDFEAVIDNKNEGDVVCSSSKKFMAIDAQNSKNYNKYIQTEKSECSERTVSKQQVFNDLLEKQGPRVDGLYRAQSCPVIMFWLQRTSSLDNSSVETAVLNPNLDSAKLRETKSTTEKADKQRNRYSCSNLDYMDYSHITGGFTRDSCPDVACFGGCQKESGTSSPDSNTSLSPSHRVFQRNVNMIQVS